MLRYGFIAAIISVGLALDSRGVALAADQTLLPAPDVAAPRLDANGQLDSAVARLHNIFLQRDKEGPIGVLFLGDSITQAWDRANDIWETHYGKLQPARFGMGGDGTQNVLWRIDHGELDGITPKVVVLLIGTNNLDNTPANVCRGVRKIVIQIHTKLPNAKLLLLGLLPRGFDPRHDPVAATARDKIAAVNKDLATLDDSSKTRFLDMGAKFVETDESISKEIMPDGLHPSAKGYQIWADTMQPLLEQMLDASATGKGKPNAAQPTLNYTVSWVGNTFAEADQWVQMDASTLAVASDGTVYGNVFWEESGRNVGMYKDGKCIGNAGHTHGWGYEGGEAVAVNDKYLFIAQHVDNEGGGLRSPNSWPAKGKGWTGISRRLRNGSAAPFAGGKGGDGNTPTACFLPINEFNEKAPVAIIGMAATNEKLCTTDAAGKIRLFDPNTMTQTAEFTVPHVGPIAMASDASLWMISHADGEVPATIVHYAITGQALRQTISGVAVPTALAFDAKGQLYVTDNGPDQQIKIFDTATCQQVGTFGIKGGVLADVKGQIGPQRFNGLTGVGLDAAGNIYVACRGRVSRFGNGTGLVLESYQPTGVRNWQLLGLEWVDMADADPAADISVYSKTQHFLMDYSRPRGQEWSYSGYTLDRFAYPNDPRMHVDCLSIFARRISGKLFLFSVDMVADHLAIFRMTARDEIAIPCGYFSQSHVPGEWPPHQPNSSQWIWLDKNGNGDFDGDEFDSDPKPGVTGEGWWVDSKGDVWQAGNADAIRRFPCQGLDAHGVPQYSYATAIAEPTPQPFTRLYRIEYFPETDTMYLAGFSREYPNSGHNWKTPGKVICRYDNWSTKKTKRWEIHPQFDELEVKSPTFGTTVSITVAGDYLFLGYEKTAEIRVYQATTGSYVGTLWPGKDMSGWLDIPYAIRAHQRADGEYLIFAEEDAKAKIMLYRWRP